MSQNKQQIAASGLQRLHILVSSNIKHKITIFKVFTEIKELKTWAKKGHWKWPGCYEKKEISSNIQNWKDKLNNWLE